MEIRKTFNTTKKEIKSKKFNIFIGVSLGNKWFTKENLREYLNWALEHTKEKVLFFIADKIHSINYEIRGGYNKKRSLSVALRNGEKIKKIVEELISELPKEKQNKIQILRWEEYEKYDKFYSKYNPVIYEEFEKNDEFKKELLNLTKIMIKDKKFSKEEYLELSKYLLEEFFSIYSGIFYKGIYYGMYPYPLDTALSSFIEKIQKGKIFPQLNKKLPKEKVALTILN